MTTIRDHLLVGPPSAASPEPARARSSGQTCSDRIVLRPPDTGAFVDGGWWPRTLDLVAELPALLMACEAAGYGEVRRINFALTAWDGLPPRRSTMLRRVVKLGGFRSQDPAEMCLVGGAGWKRIIVVVVPPATDPTVAGSALAMAGMNGDRHRAREILDLAGLAPPVHGIEPAGVNELALAAWESEGGHVTRITT